ILVARPRWIRGARMARRAKRARQRRRSELWQVSMRERTFLAHVCAREKAFLLPIKSRPAPGANGTARDIAGQVFPGVLISAGVRGPADKAFQCSLRLAGGD